MHMDINLEQILAMEPDIPCYWFQTETLYQNLERFRTLIAPEVKVTFSAKANPFLVEAALKKFDGIEICSVGELCCALKNKADTKRIVYGGICKEMSDLDEMVHCGIRRFSVESYQQLGMLEKTAARHQVNVKALLRISSGNQFGMSASEYHKCNTSQDLKYTTISGIHFYPGTMRKTIDQIEKDFEKFQSLMGLLHMPDGQEIYYGAGIAFPYYDCDKSYDHWLLAGKISEHLNQLSRKYQVTYEAGRLFAADAGVYIARVAELRNSGDKEYVIINGGRHQFTYYGGLFGLGGRVPKISVFGQKQTGRKIKADIVGALCTEGDLLAKEIELPEVGVGDYIVFHNAGAYCMTEGMALFLSRDIPAVFLSGDKISRRRQKRNVMEYLEIPEDKEDERNVIR